MVNSALNTDDFDTIQLTAHGGNVNVGKPIQLKTRSATLTTVFSTVRDLLPFKQKLALAQRQLLPANRFMEVLPNKTFHILLTSISSQHCRVPET